MTMWNKGALRPLVGDLRQVASVRRIVLDDGPERGVRALQFSTGGGFDFTALADRSLDLGTLAWNGIPLAWQSAGGFAAPGLLDREGDGGLGFNRGFSGFLVTCGLNHIRVAANGEPQHGRFPFTPATVRAYGEAWDAEAPHLYCEGEATQFRYGAEGLRLHRRIEAPIGGAELVIRDSVENIGPASVKQPIMYHFNLGYPANATGTVVELNGVKVLGPLKLADRDGLISAFTRPATGGDGTCVVRSPSGFEVRFELGTETLTHLQLWHDLRPHVGVLSIEPCTSAWPPENMEQPEAILEPGERRSYRIAISVKGSAAVG